jgi:hypothetical protein
MRNLFRISAIGLVLFAFIATPLSHAQTNPASVTAPSVANTAWVVTASWSAGHIFYWAFWDNGHYQDTDGAYGTWTQNGSSLALLSAGGFIYRITLNGDSGSGSVYSQSSGAVAGTFTVQRVVPH